MRSSSRRGRMLAHRRDAGSAEEKFLSSGKIIRFRIFSAASESRRWRALRNRNSAQCRLKQLSNLLIACRRFCRGASRAVDNPMPFQNAPRVSVHHKDRMIAGIQQNRVRGLRPYAIERQQFVAEFSRWSREHARQRAAVALIEKVHEGFQPLRFLPEVARRTDQLLQLRLRRAADSADRQKSRSPEGCRAPSQRLSTPCSGLSTPQQSPQNATVPATSAGVPRRKTTCGSRRGLRLGWLRSRGARLNRRRHSRAA